MGQIWERRGDTILAICTYTDMFGQRGQMNYLTESLKQWIHVSELVSMATAWRLANEFEIAAHTAGHTNILKAFGTL
jgi:hypothetical protein